MYRFSFYEFVCEADHRFRFMIPLNREMSGSFLDVNIPGGKFWLCSVFINQNTLINQAVYTAWWGLYISIDKDIILKFLHSCSLKSHMIKLASVFWNGKVVRWEIWEGLKCNLLKTQRASYQNKWICRLSSFAAEALDGQSVASNFCESRAYIMYSRYQTWQSLKAFIAHKTFVFWGIETFFSV